MTDSITIIRSPYLLLAKRIHADSRTEPYGSAKTIDLFERPVPDLDALRALIAKLIPRPDCAVVFGGVADPERVRHVRRLSKADLKTGDLPTLRVVPHRWCALDMDGVERPLDVPAHDLAACAGHAVQRLPIAFHGARCIVQASASHGIKPGCRLRLWFWLDRPVTGAELKVWLKPHPVDPCTFVTAQPIYTAAPVLVGRPDHLPTRLADVPGAQAVAVPAPELLKPPEKPRPQAPAEAATISQERVRRIIDDALRRVRNAPNDGKHYALRNNARLLGGIAAQAGLSDSYLIDRLIDALPAGVEDWNRAKETAEWGLAIGRGEPIEIPPDDPKSSAPDPRRSETAKTAFRLLRAGIAGEAILATLDEQNAERDEPLPAEVIRSTAQWAASQLRGDAHA